MFLIGLFIHVTFLFSIFDIYFKSPIVNGIIPYQPKHDAAADRLVLFIVDGLRAESFTNYTTMPYLRSIANSIGRWGISNTQVPTESRPGHVAVIAGFYEDPSAVAKGWKENPVDFDSVFNQTQHTWCWGAYDIVNIFTKGHDDHITGNVFDPYDHSFSTSKNTTHLDGWVFENVQNMFYEAKHQSMQSEELSKKKIIFFLHLLGTDTSGHTHKPKTSQFLTQLRYVDEGIKEMEKVIRHYYNDDGKTTFLMTSDHGMTDWGSHGSGDDHETQTPYVIWGSGINTIETKKVTHDPYTLSMSLEHKLDLNQVDLAPLMSTILSIPVPVNSIGKVRTELLNMTLPNKAMAIYSNSRQLVAQYNKKRLDIETNAISYLYQPYIPLTQDKYDEIISFTEKLILEENYEQLILFSEDIIRLSLEGLKYYHNYYQGPLLILVTLSFMGWIAYLLKIILIQKLTTESESSNFNKTLRILGISVQEILNVSFSVISFVSICIVCVQNLPVQYYIYFLMPILLWWYALSPLNVWIKAIKRLRESKKCPVLIEILSYSIGSAAMSMSFTYRWMLSIPLLGMAVWPFLSSARKYLGSGLLTMWCFGCLALSIFSFIPVVGKEVSIELVVVSGALWLVIVIIYIKNILLTKGQNKGEYKRETILMIIQMAVLIISLHNIYTQSKSYDAGDAVSTSYKIIAWAVAVACFIIPLTFSRRLICRLFAIYTSILNFYLLLSVSHEGLFMVSLILNSISWIFIEFKILCLKDIMIVDYNFKNQQNKNIKSNFTEIERSLNREDFRRAFFFLLYIILAFFGTGNIASVNSFEIRWVVCFLTSFQPFVITTLILLKTLAPFLVVACSFRAIQCLTKAPVGYLNIVVLIYSNIMGIYLLYKVKNTGSWLEIGTSISHFVIVQVITLFIVIINQFARAMTDFSSYNLMQRLLKSHKKYE